MNISLAIANYVATDTIGKLVSHNINNPHISEIVVTQEKLEGDLYIAGRVKELVDVDKKVRFYQNEKRLGAFLNKLKAVELCKSEWIALCDSDNFMDETYFEVLNQHDLDVDTLYCPSWGRPIQYDTLNYKSFAGTKFNGISCLMENRGHFFQTGNYFFNRKKYIEVANVVLENTPKEHHGCIGFDSFVFVYYWLLEGKTVFCVPDLEYDHPEGHHAGSAWIISNEQQYWLEFVKDKTGRYP